VEELDAVATGDVGGRDAPEAARECRARGELDGLRGFGGRYGDVGDGVTVAQDGVGAGVARGRSGIASGEWWRRTRLASSTDFAM
jgi:hypothetical protein